MPIVSRTYRFPAFMVMLAAAFLSSLACTTIPLLAPTPTPTSTPTATLTPTKTIAPTVSYLDWPVVFSDTFNADRGDWLTGPQNNEYVSGDIAIADGKYLFQLTAKKPFFWRLSPQIKQLKNFYLSVE
jgi:hypothetical protein